MIMDEQELKKLSSVSAKKMIRKLSAEISKYNKAYYQDNSSIISDSEYDYLFHNLLKLEEFFPEHVVPTSPTQKVGHKIEHQNANTKQIKLKKHIHTLPMLSLSNGFSEEDISNFITRYQNFLNIDDFLPIFCEPKIDGISFTAIYINGNLTIGSTRGDGYIGENITENIKTLQKLPHQIHNAPDFLEVRGEIFINKNDFNQLNKELKKENKSTFANPRNFASGSLRQLDTNITAMRPLKYFVYSIGKVSDENFVSSQAQCLRKLSELGFVVNGLSKLAMSFDDIMSFYNNVLGNREKTSYEIDGIVYKINDFNIQKRLGFISRSPRFAIAHKFPAEILQTKLLNINIQVGRTGALTPVGILEPIHIAGVVVSRATLHNFQEIKRKDIRIGDYVFLQRSGDVIPKITGVNIIKRGKEAKLYSFPTHCPSCSAEVTFNSDEAILRCHNTLNCPGQRYQAICHFVSKGAMNISGLGNKQVKFLLDNKLINNPVDIFLLEEKNKISLTKLENMPGWGTLSVNNLFDKINDAKNISLEKFIYALGIRQVGENGAKLIAKEFKTAKFFIESMKLLTNHNKDADIFNQLINIDGIGKSLIIELKNFFKINENFITTYQLTKVLSIQNAEITQRNGILSGQNIVFTGSLSTLSRAEAKAQAEKFGAKVTSTVTNKTNLVVAGDMAGSKLKKAKELGIKVVDEQKWFKLIRTSIESVRSTV